MIFIRTIRRLLIGFLLLQTVCLGNAHAQSAPSPLEISTYQGLQKAAHEGNVEAALSLIETGVDIEVRDVSGRTPLLIAAFALHEPIIKLLAEAGADLNAMEHRAYDIVTIAAVENDVEMLTTAIALGASAANITSPYHGTALIAAAHLGHHQVVDLLIKNKAPLDHVNNLHWTALIEAVVLGQGGTNHTETAKLLLKAGADQNIADSQGVTPLDHAKSRDYESMIQLFNDYD